MTDINWNNVSPEKQRLPDKPEVAAKNKAHVQEFKRVQALGWEYEAIGQHMELWNQAYDNGTLPASHCTCTENHGITSTGHCQSCGRPKQLTIQ